MHKTIRILTLVAAMIIGAGETWALKPTPIGSIEYNSTLGAYEIKSTANLNDLAVYVNGQGTYSTGGDETEAHNCEGLTFKMTADIAYNPTTQWNNASSEEL